MTFFLWLPLRIIDQFGKAYTVSHWEVISNGNGDFIRGSYREEGAMWDYERGDFDISKCESIVPLAQEQLAA